MKTNPKNCFYDFSFVFLKHSQEKKIKENINKEILNKEKKSKK